MGVINQAKETFNFFQKSFSLQKGNKKILWLGLIAYSLLVFLAKVIAPILFIVIEALFSNLLSSTVSGGSGMGQDLINISTLLLIWPGFLMIMVIQTLIFCGLLEVATSIINAGSARFSMIWTHFNRRSFAKLWPALFLFSVVTFLMVTFFVNSESSAVSEFMFFIMEIIAIIILHEKSPGGIRGLAFAMKTISKNIMYFLVYCVGAVIMTCVSLLSLFILMIWFVPMLYLTLGQIILAMTEKNEPLTEKSDQPLMRTKDI